MVGQTYSDAMRAVLRINVSWVWVHFSESKIGLEEESLAKDYPQVVSTKFVTSFTRKRESRSQGRKLTTGIRDEKDEVHKTFDLHAIDISFANAHYLHS